MAPAAGSGNVTELLYGLHAVREALRAGDRPLSRVLILNREGRLGEIFRLAREAQVPVHVEPKPALDRLAPAGRHQGVVALVAAKAYVDEEAILETARSAGEAPLLVVLDGVEDPQNLGAALRVSEAAGAHGVFIPERRAVGLTAIVAKASAGALEHLRVARVANVSRLIERLQEEGIWVYGVEPGADKPYTSLDLTGAVALVFGAEGKGIRHGVLEHCDGRVRIPMRGQVESLNVSTAVAVVLFEAVRQRLEKLRSEGSPPGSRT